VTLAARHDSDARANAALTRYVAGEEAAFGDLYALLAPRLHRYLMARACDEATRHDLVQETMLRMHLTRARLRPGAPVMPWVLTVLRRLWIETLRRGARETLLEGAGDDLSSNDAGPDHSAELRELADHMCAALTRLPELHRAAFDLVRSEGLSVKDAAKKLRTTSCAVKLRSHRAYQALRAELEVA
jgi:RNA polymerase sigma-70 factor (ECF subfamily)